MSVTISFDLWNTLIIPNPGYKDARNKLISRITGIDVDTVSAAHLKVKRVLDSINALGYSPRTRVCWNMLEVELNREFYYDFNIEFTQLVLDHPPLVDSSIVSWFNELLLSDIKVGITSNTNMISGNTLRDVLYTEYGFELKLLAWDMFSDEHSVAKPASLESFKWYNKTIHKAHVGDTVETDGLFATRLGWDFIHVRNPNDTIDYVNSYIKGLN